MVKLLTGSFTNPSRLKNDTTKTLTDEQIDKIMNKLKLNFEKELGAVLR